MPKTSLLWAAILVSISTPAAAAGDKTIFEVAVAEVLSAFSADAAAHGGTLNIDADWEADGENSWSQRGPTSWDVHVTGGIFRAPSMTVDAFQLVMCHEVGHLLGGAPFYQSGPVTLSVSAEGEADYFAGHVCTKRLWRDQDVANQAAFDAAGHAIQDRCRDAFIAIADRNLCARTALAATAMIRAFDSPSVDVATPDRAVARASLLSDYPAAQCRLDTILSGAVCINVPSPWIMPGFVPGRGNTPAAIRAALDASCSTTDARGARPACWFRE